MTHTDIVSSLGVSLILLAFILTTFKYISDTSKFYFMLNIIGGALACYGSMLLNSMPFVILEGTWGLIALIGLIRTYLKQ